MLQPYGNRILVSRIPERVTSALLIVPDTVSERPSPFGMVLAVGNKVRENVQPGDTVVLSDYSGAPTTVEVMGTSVDAYIVPISEVLMVIEQDLHKVAS